MTWSLIIDQQMFAMVKLFSPSSTLSVYNEEAASADLDIDFL